MPISKAVLAAFRAASRLKPDVKETYEAQRVAEEVLGKLSLPNPRCRIDEASAPMPDVYAVPLRVFTPLDIDFSLASVLKVPFTHPPPWKNRMVPRESSVTLRPEAREKSMTSGVNTRRGTA